MSSRNASNPLITLVVPFYNLEDYALRSVQSFLAQTYPNCEFVFVDDGSTDRTPAILDELAKNDQRVRIIHKQNEGVAVARNRGVQSAKGEYVSFADGDDIVSPWYIETMANVMSNRKDTLIFAESRIVKAIKADVIEWPDRPNFSFQEMDRGGGCSDATV